MNVKIISGILTLALVPLASLACGFSVDLPRQLEAGPDVEETISVEVPDSDNTSLRLSFGAGKLTLSPGADVLVDGTALYNVEELKPEVIEDGAEIEINQGNFEGLPPFDGMNNEWDLRLGKTPMELFVDAGAYSGNYELGGLALKSLRINDGASEVRLSFSKPNRVEMSELRYSTGASEVRLEGLGNANFDRFVFNGGAGDYTLDFSGELQRDATASIDCGFGDVTLIIPEGVNAVITLDGALTDVNLLSRGWTQSGNVYSQEGEGPTLTIFINLGAGNLTISD